MNYFTKWVLSLIFFCSTAVTAQNTDLYNVKLKSGLIIKCEVIKIVPDSFITIRQYGLISNISYREIASIEISETKIETPSPRVQSVEKYSTYRKNIPDSGITTGLQTGFCFGVNSDGFPAAGILLRFNLMKSVSKRWQTGLSLGLDPYLYNDIVAAPVTAEVRYQLEVNKPRVSFMYGNAGYGFNLTSENMSKYGGMNYGFGLGRAFRGRHQTIFSIMIGYRMQSLKDEELITWQSNLTRLYYYQFRRFEYKVEWRF